MAWSALDGGQPAAAVRAVVEVLRRELLQRAAAEAEVLDRPGQLARRRGERQHACRRPRTPRRCRDRRRRSPGSTSRMTSRSDRARRRYSLAVTHRGRNTTSGSARIRPFNRPILSPMRILIFHGYLLRGTGSNIYNASLADALRRARPRGAPALPGPPRRRAPVRGRRGPLGGREPGRGARSRAGALHGVPAGHRPRAARLRRGRLRGLRRGAVPGPERRGELEHYLERERGRGRGGGGAVRPGRRRWRTTCDGARDLSPGTGRARSLRGEDPRQRARVHGAPDPERFLPYAREGLEGAAGVLVGSRHTAESCGR